MQITAGDKRKHTDSTEWTVRIGIHTQLRIIPKSRIMFVEKTVIFQLGDGPVELPMFPTKIVTIPAINSMRELNAVAKKYSLENSHN